MEIVLLVVGLSIGFGGAWMIQHFRYAGKQTVTPEDIHNMRESLGSINAEKARFEERSAWFEAALIQSQAELSEQRQISITSTTELATEQEKGRNLLERLEQHAQEINDLQERSRIEFENLANRILEEKSRRFTEQNQIHLGHLLNPLQERIKAFQAKVEEVYINEGKDRSALGEQVKQLLQLNNTLSQDAQNLAMALKGDRKAQGDWGEIILDDVLERAGLQANMHYTRQGSVQSEDGQARVIPDVVVNLPGDRRLVVDSKFTLPDYRAFTSTDDKNERSAALKRHLGSIRVHMRGLSEKNYQSLYGINSLDFVIMFIPLEPAFMLAVTNDNELFQQAWDKNVLLVSPSTLLFVVRTVSNLWRQESLSRNAQDISKRGAELYDKLVGFVGDFQKVGERIQQAHEYTEARRKFGEGSGNLIRQAEMLKQMGVKPSKSLPEHWVAGAMEEPLPAPPNEG